MKASRSTKLFIILWLPWNNSDNQTRIFVGNNSNIIYRIVIPPRSSSGRKNSSRVDSIFYRTWWNTSSLHLIKRVAGIIDAVNHCRSDGSPRDGDRTSVLASWSCRWRAAMSLVRHYRRRYRPPNGRSSNESALIYSNSGSQK